MAHNHGNEHGHAHAHGHSHGGGDIGVAFFLNLSFTVIELFGGIFTNSIAIMSDAVHDLGDSLSLGLAWYFQRLSGKGRTNRYTYGYKRFSLLGAIITSAMLLAGSSLILARAVPRLFAPQETNATGMMGLAVLGLVVNGVAALRTSHGSSINERVVSLHLLEDVLGWAAVLVGSILIRFTGLTIIDPILSVAIACFVLFNVVKNIRQALPILLQSAPADLEKKDIANLLKQFDNIKDVHDLHIWTLDEEYNVLTAHIALERLMSQAELIELKCMIRAALAVEGVQHATMEFEAPGETCDFAEGF